MHIHFGGTTVGTIQNAIANLVKDAQSVAVAVSYIQVSGWRAFSSLLRGVHPKNVRIVCTDQLGITQPDAIREAIEFGADIRLYAGRNVFHPKMYLSRDSKGATRFIIGSANLSKSAFDTSVENLVVADDPGKCQEWFDDLFANSIKITAEILDTMDRVFAAKAKAQISIVPSLPRSKRKLLESEIIDDVFSSINNDVVILGFDQAGNNIRNLQHALDVLHQASWSSKQRSELSILGFFDNGAFTTLGNKGAAAKNPRQLGETWIKWLKFTKPNHLPNNRLLLAKRAFSNFWKLQSDVIEYFIKHAHNPSPKEKKICQVIELLANAGTPAQSLSLDDAKALVPILDDVSGISTAAAPHVRSYLVNKGARNWRVRDRALLVKTWQEV